MILDPKYDTELYRRAIDEQKLVPHRLHEFVKKLPDYNINPLKSDIAGMFRLCYVAQMHYLVRIELLRGADAEGHSQIIDNYNDKASGHVITLIRASQVLNGFTQALFGDRRLLAPEPGISFSLWRSGVNGLARLRALACLSSITPNDAAEPSLDNFIFMYAGPESRIVNTELSLRNCSPVVKTQPFTQGKYN